MDKALLGRALARYFGGLLLVGLLLFLPAGTLGYLQAWRLIGALFLPMLAAGLVMLRKRPELLKKRLNAREEQPEQRRAVALSGLMFVASFILAGLNFRFGWIVLPEAASWAAVAVFLAAYALYAEVLRENAYLSRTVEVQADQRVIDTGLYGIVRHPMYTSTIFLFLSMPLILGSVPSLVVMLAYLPIIRRRILNEEAVLSRSLDGYSEYRRRVRYRILPYIW